MHNILHEDYLRELINDLAVLGQVDAHELTDAIIELLIATLVHDPAIPSRTHAEWWARLGNVRARVVELLHRHIDEHVAVQDVLRTLEFEGA
jgi:hypothetical protein